MFILALGTTCIPGCLLAAADASPPTNPPTDQVEITRTGASEVDVTRNGAPVQSDAVHIEVVPQDPSPHQVEIVPTDLTSSSAPIPAASPDGASGTVSHPSAEKLTDTEPSSVDKAEPRPLRLQLREFDILRAAARQAGGDLEIFIRPVRISGDDLIVPLADSGYFEVKADSSQPYVLVRSRTVDPYEEQLRQQVAQLEKHRQALLSDIHVLEGLQRDKQ